MNQAREAVIGVLAVACVMAVMLLIGIGDSTLMLACVAFSAVLFQASLQQGPLAGGTTGVAAALGLVRLRQKTGSSADAMLFLAAAGLPVMGLVFGVRLAARNQQAKESEQAGVVLRRELYRLKKESKAARAPDTPALIRQVAEPAAAPENDQLDLLEQTVARIASSLTEHRVIESAVASVQALLGAEQACFHLHERGTDRFLPGRGQQPADEELPVGENEILLQLVRSRREILVRTMDDERAAQAFAAARPEVHLAAPVFDRAMLTGVLLTSRPAQPGVDSQKLLGVLAAASGLALASVRLVAASDEQSRRDPLTGLVNVEAIRSRLDECLLRGPVAVLLVAADAIQRVNKTYGRRAGDRVVAGLSRLVSMEIGSAGQVGRFGGATLLVVLPGHRLEAASDLAVRLKRRVPLSLHAGPEGLAGPLEVSVGVAAASAGSVDMLTQAAEQSLAEDQRTLMAAQTRRTEEGQDVDAQP